MFLYTKKQLLLRFVLFTFKHRLYAEHRWQIAVVMH